MLLTCLRSYTVSYPILPADLPVQVDLEVLRHMGLTTAKTEALREQLATAWAQRGLVSTHEEEEAALQLLEKEALAAAAAAVRPGLVLELERGWRW